ncbi:MAG: diacylglycerol kinase [Actinophytocola sp.]|nr:diacylglycerol kinase [Actinophytocola sp.]
MIIANPAAGGVTAALVWRLTRLTRRCRRPASVRWTSAPGDAVGIAREATASADLVIAVGGDGTAREVAAGLATAWRHTVPMLIVPAGTANSLYRTLWGTTPWEEALDVALSGATPIRADLARVVELDRLVLAGACAGFPPQGIHEAKTRAVSYPAALLDLAPRYEPYPGRVLVDGVVVHSGPTMLANVGGSRYRGGAYELLPHSRLDDGLLDVCVVGAEHSALEMLRLTRTGAHLDVPGVVYARGTRIRVERLDGHPLCFEHDGEVLRSPRTSYTLTARPGAVAVLAAPSELAGPGLPVVDTGDAA